MTMPPPRPPFRAGLGPGEAPAPPGAAAAPLSAAPETLLADLSEWEPEIADAVYLRWSKAVIFRGLYGTTIDKAWYGGGRRAALHAGGAQFVGIYAYVVASESVLDQARAMVDLIGELRPGEKILADIEEGAGNLQAAWQVWADTVDGGLGDPPWDYSGAAFAAAHGLQPVTWVASYGSAEPAAPHQLWQFTSAYRVPGVGDCDCSVFHGTVGQLAAMAWQGGPAPRPEPVLAAGMTGTAVAAMQRRLDAWGAASPPLAADGRFGALTDAAVRKFQASMHIRADGVCGPVTWTILNANPGA